MIIMMAMYDNDDDDDDDMVLKPQDSFGRFVKIFLDLQKVDHTIRKHH